MRLTLGPRSYDLTTRALVIGVLDPDAPVARLCHQAEALVADGADILEVTGAGVEPVTTVVRALTAHVAIPVGVVTRRDEVARAAQGAGAALITYFDGAEAGAAVTTAVIVASADEARHALDAGIPGDGVVIDLGDRLRPRPGELGLGCPLLVSTTASTLDGLGVLPNDRRAAGLAAVALAVSEGCRLVRADDVRGARRVCDVLAAMLGSVAVEAGAETRT